MSFELERNLKGIGPSQVNDQEFLETGTLRNQRRWRTDQQYCHETFMFC
jgi:hypothetical protein